MKALKTVLGLLLLACLSWGCATGIEEAPYTVVRQDENLELRDYASHIVAETKVESTLEEAGNKAFRRLFNYISGENRQQQEIAMTAPVTQKASSEKIAMTAPVGQQRRGDAWVVSFMMPESYTMETLPAPENPAVRLREVPARRVAAVRYSGTWSEARYREHLAELEAWMADEGLQAAGQPIWARYNAPITPWFLRRNEVLIPVNGEARP